MGQSYSKQSRQITNWPLSKSTDALESPPAQLSSLMGSYCALSYHLAWTPNTELSSSTKIRSFYRPGLLESPCTLWVPVVHQENWVKILARCSLLGSYQWWSWYHSSQSGGGVWCRQPYLAASACSLFSGPLSQWKGWIRRIAFWSRWSTSLARLRRRWPRMDRSQIGIQLCSVRRLAARGSLGMRFGVWRLPLSLEQWWMAFIHREGLSTFGYSLSFLLSSSQEKLHTHRQSS